MIATFTMTGELPGLNEIICIARRNRFAGASQKKKETTRCMQAVMLGQVPTFTVPVKVHFRWIEKNLRRDPDNICGGGQKFLMDALVEMKKIPNDSRRWIMGLSHEFPEPDKNNPRIEIVISTEV